MFINVLKELTDSSETLKKKGTLAPRPRCDGALHTQTLVLSRQRIGSDQRTAFGETNLLIKA